MTRKPFVPRPWQVPMLQHLFKHKRCALWAGMGLGKTPVVLTFLEALYFSEDPGCTLIIGPLRVARSVWTKECAKWEHLSGLQVVPIIGSIKERTRAVATDAKIFTTNYDNLIWLTQYWGARWPYKVVIADESDYIKGHRMSFRTATKADGSPGKEFVSGQGAKRAGELARVAHTYVDRFIELTGTPAPNGLLDLWGQLWFLDRGVRLGRSYDAFRKRWFTKGYDGFSYEPNDNSDSEIHRKVGDLCLTIDGADWFDLDKPIVNKIYVDLPTAARGVYDEMAEKMFIELQDRTAEAVNAAAKTMKCLQIANGAVYVDPEVDGDEHPRAKEWRGVHDEKIEALDSIVHEANGAPLLVCYEFKSDLERLMKAFPKARVLKTQADEDAFKSGKVPILFLHPKSGGHGIDGFQNVCNNIVFFGHNWNLGQHLQVIERIGPVRQMQAGFRRPVFIHYIIARDTVDELVMDRRESKRAVQDILLEACKRRASSH